MQSEAIVIFAAALAPRLVLGSDILPRQNVASAVCDSILKTAPTAPPDVNSALAKYPQSDSCHVTLPGTVQDDWSSYLSQVKSWLDDNEKITGCQGYSQFMSHAAVNCKASSTSADSSPAASSSSVTGTGSASAAASPSSSTAAAAPRETGGGNIIIGLAAAALAMAAV